MSISDGDSLSSGHDAENKEKSKIWTAEEVELLHILLRKYGTDFHILSNFFPRKTKSQLKVIYLSCRIDTSCISVANGSGRRRRCSS
jgi:hypothetical protein